MTERRDLNWFGWSADTRAAVYETDAAAREYEQGLVNLDYVWTAWRAESQEDDKDREQKENDERQARRAQGSTPACQG